MLFDTGADESFIKTANLLGENLNNVDTVVISHGHYDHGDGLLRLNNKNVFVGKGVFTKRFSKRRNGVSSALSYGKEITKLHNFHFVKKKLQIYKNVFLFKTNDRPFHFENNNYPTYLKNGKDDIVKDEISMAITTSNGLVIISGCSHAGICNIVQNAKNIFKQEKILAVIGGFHLTNKIERAKMVVNKLTELGVENCYTGHCISNECIEIIKQIIPNTVILKTGLVFEIKTLL